MWSEINKCIDVLSLTVSNGFTELPVGGVIFKVLELTGREGVSKIQNGFPPCCRLRSLAHFACLGFGVEDKARGGGKGWGSTTGSNRQ